MTSRPAQARPAGREASTRKRPAPSTTTQRSAAATRSVPAARRPVQAAKPKRQRAVSRAHRAQADESSRRRIRIFKLILLLCLVAITVRLVDIQVRRHVQYQHTAKLQLRRTVAIPAVRGGIYDRNGAVLAMSVPTKTVIADNFQISHPVDEAKALAPILGVPVSDLTTQLSQHSGYQVLTKNLSLSKAAIVSRDQFPGITMVDSSVRHVPNGSLAQSVIGMTNATGTGASGIEYQRQKLLAGTAGSTTLLETPYGVSLPQGGALKSRSSTPGQGLELTLDQPLQYVTEQALGQQIAASGALSGTAIVMDVKTGQILSMANLASTSPQSGPIPVPLTSQNPSPIPGVAQAQNNLAVTQTYEPGSVFKLVAFSAALDSGAISPTTTFDVPDQVQLDGKTFHDAEQHAPMAMTATDILAQSSNIGTYMIARGLGETKLLAQVQKLGFGQSTGLNFPGESSGLLMNAARWQPTDLAALPIGQVDATTPLQVLDAYNAVANGGTFVYPSLVRGTVAPSGSVGAVPTSPGRRVMSPTTASQLTEMLRQVVLNGTGGEAAVPGYKVAGKTGTSQIPTPGQASYVDGAYNATFVGFAPADHPVLSAMVVLQRPVGSYFGGAVAAPVFSKIMSYALHRYGVPTSAGGGDTSSVSGAVVQEAT